MCSYVFACLYESVATHVQRRVCMHAFMYAFPAPCVTGDVFVKVPYEMCIYVC